MSEEDKKQLTVGDLMKILAKCDSSAKVSMEGCDCWQEAGGVYNDSGELLICNSSSNSDYEPSGDFWQPKKARYR